MSLKAEVGEAVGGVGTEQAISEPARIGVTVTMYDGKVPLCEVRRLFLRRLAEFLFIVAAGIVGFGLIQYFYH